MMCSIPSHPMLTIRNAIERLHWEGLEPKEIVLTLRQNRHLIKNAEAISEERVIEMIKEMEGIVDER